MQGGKTVLSFSVSYGALDLNREMEKGRIEWLLVGEMKGAHNNDVTVVVITKRKPSTLERGDEEWRAEERVVTSLFVCAYRSNVQVDRIENMSISSTKGEWILLPNSFTETSGR